ncbi:MAG: prolipoprotein diacylglyceryl transferase [Candidatus Riflebacteria bacterium]|nr:prolipoprotein diacylglyceryl transferase [Candidatus Riflebacteria bacterium]
MYPVLFSIGDFDVHTFGVLLALGFIAGVYTATIQAERAGLDLDQVTNVLLLILACSIIGARAAFVAVSWQHFVANPMEVIRLHKGGLVYYGGLIGGLLAGLVGTRMAHLPLGRFADIIPAGLCIGQILGRLGCFANGCCYGAVCSVPWAVRLHSGPGAMVPRHPTQLYEALFLSAILAVCLWLFRRPHRPGMVMVLYLYLYGVGRYAVELFRGDDRGASPIPGLSVSQSISLGVLVLASIVHLLAARQPLAAAEPPPEKPDLAPDPL